MFLSFFYLLRANGLKVSLDEWLTVLKGLQMGLHNSSISGFYELCRAVVVSSEADFDRFDQVFLEFFRGIDFQQELPDEMRQWLEHPELEGSVLEKLAETTGMSVEEIEELFARRLQDQDEEHNGGRKWIGTSGYTPYGNHGKRLGGIRVGGESGYRSAYRIAGERKYRDWRRDNTLDSRQFQIAFRSLRQLSRNTDQPKTEVDVDATVRETCRQAGRLSVEYTHPRKNALKVLLLMDSGGSMDVHRKLCSLLFQSVSKASHFKDLKIYYFHNCVRSILYTEPTLDYRQAISTDWVFQNISSDYRVIFVGDGEMALDELTSGWEWGKGATGGSGLEWLLKFKAHYPHIIWLHPQPRPEKHSYWTQTFDILDQHLDMYQMSLDGLSQGMKKLMVNR